jgi:hypothetical protein
LRSSVGTATKTVQNPQIQCSGVLLVVTSLQT